MATPANIDDLNVFIIGYWISGGKDTLIYNILQRLDIHYRQHRGIDTELDIKPGEG